MLIQHGLAWSGAGALLNFSTEGSAFGDMTAGGGLAALFDSNTGTAGRREATSGYAGRNLSAARRRFLSHAVVKPASNGFDGSGTSTSITLTLYGKVGTAPASGTDGTSLAVDSFTDVESLTNIRTLVSSDQGTAWDHVWVRITSGVWANATEIEFWGYN